MAPLELEECAMAASRKQARRSNGRGRGGKAAVGKLAPKGAQIVSGYTPARVMSVAPGTLTLAAMDTETTSVTVDYVCLSVPTGCNSYTNGTFVTLTVSDPPPQYVTVNLGPGCDPVFAELADSQEGGGNGEGGDETGEGGGG